MPENPSWIAAIRYINSGYIKDDDAKTWDVDDLFQSIKNATEAQNKDRIAQGFQPIHVLKWIQPPKYDSVTHQLIWSILSCEGDKNNEGDGVNYDIFSLGRDGYFHFDLMSDPKNIYSDIKDSSPILNSLRFNNNTRYEDFSSKTDHIAEYGLAALVTGVVAKKVGLLAMAAIFIAKIWKLVVVSFLVVWGGIKKILGIKTKTTK